MKQSALPAVHAKFSGKSGRVDILQRLTRSRISPGQLDGPYETVADFGAADVTIQEFRIAALMDRVARLSDARAAYERGREILKSQTYRVKRILEAGDELAVELEWTGILAVPVMSLPTGSEMKAFVAMFLTFRDGKIAAQRNYDCYPPFGPQDNP
jgi:ketosteroid isomerase-like protein